MTTISLEAMNLAAEWNRRAGPSMGPEESPPAKSVADFGEDETMLVVMALNGLMQTLQALTFQTRPGTRTYESAMLLIGRLTVMIHQLERGLPEKQRAALNPP